MLIYILAKLYSKTGNLGFCTEGEIMNFDGDTLEDSTLSSDNCS